MLGVEEQQNPVPEGRKAAGWWIGLCCQPLDCKSGKNGAIRLGHWITFGKQLLTVVNRLLYRQ